MAARILAFRFCSEPLRDLFDWRLAPGMLPMNQAGEVNSIRTPWCRQRHFVS